MVKIKLKVDSHGYTYETVSQVQEVWKYLLDTVYKQYSSDSELSLIIDGRLDTDISNFDELCFDTMWKDYVGDPEPNYELKKLEVPSFLFICPGYLSFMREMFPECELILSSF